MARPFDGGERLTRVGGIGLEDVAAAPCLKNHDADRMRDHVVELASDPGSLLDNRRSRPGLLLFEVSLAKAPPPHRPTGHPRQAEEESQEDGDFGGDTVRARH